MTRRILALCPVCWHDTTWRAIRQRCEPVRDDTPNMLWNRHCPGTVGTGVTANGGGHWSCPSCGISLPPRIAAVLIDAVLRVSDHDSDSYDYDEEHFADAVLAAVGGRN